MNPEWKQTCLVRKAFGGLENLIRIRVRDMSDGNVEVYVDDEALKCVKSEEGFQYEYWISEDKEPCEIQIRCVCDGKSVQTTATLKKPKHYTVYLNHLSHHDPGYTDLMSHVFLRHYRWIDQVLDEMDKRDHYPEDARLRITIEQFWSLDYYLKHAPAERTDKLIQRVKRGDIELTALFGNMITEQLGHEESYQILYDAAAFAKKCGVTLKTAMHNDVPGISWGMCRCLCDCKIPYLNAAFPPYYDWGYENLVSFWDSQAAYGYKGPGACFWCSPNGEKVLLWNTNSYEQTKSSSHWLEERLDQLEEFGYPFETYKETVKVSNIDNSCYSGEYADFVAQWNEQYEFPHLISGTNTAFFDALCKEIEEKKIEIPHISGEMPGQDYPLGAMSMASITSTALRTQHKAVVAEKLLTVTEEYHQTRPYDQVLKEVWYDLLISDDHAYGHQFPAGPSMRASYWEKGSYAMRAEANTHDLVDKAMSSLTDRIDSGSDDSLKLLVFHPGQTRETRGVKVAMRELDNCGTEIFTDNHDKTALKGYLLDHRRRVNPEEKFWKKGEFELIDIETGRSVPYFIQEQKWDDAEYDAPERAGLGSGTNRYGFFEHPGGMKQVLHFVAQDLPPFGYRCYSLVKRETSHALSSPGPCKELNNGIYRICTDKRGICSVKDLRSGDELLDLNSPHRLGEVLVRNKREETAHVMKVKKTETRQNDVYGEIKLYGEIDGAYEVSVTVSLWQGNDRIFLDLHLLKGAKPLQTMFIAFPFAGNGFRYESVLSEQEPANHIVPGGQSDFLTVKDYVHVKGSDILWSSSDTGVVSLGGLKKGYLSPAHSCIMEQETHLPFKEDAFCSGSVYAMLSCNNFGTNFMCSQVFRGVYHFSFGVNKGVTDEIAALWGECEQNPVVTQFTDRNKGDLPPAASLIDTGLLHCLTVKRREDGSGYLVRLWNHGKTTKPVRLWYKGQEITEFVVCNGLEEELGFSQHVEIAPNDVLTLKFQKPDY